MHYAPPYLRGHWTVGPEEDLVDPAHEDPYLKDPPHSQQPALLHTLLKIIVICTSCFSPACLSCTVNNLFFKFKLFRQLTCFYALKSFLRVQHSLKNIFQLCGLVQCAFGLQAWSFVILLCVE